MRAEQTRAAGRGQAPGSITYVDAIRDAMAEELERDDRVILLGEDVAQSGGVYGASRGLLERFGPHRVIDTPISEAGIVGVAVGAAMAGLRPIVEVMFSDFLGLAMDQIVNQAAKTYFMSGGELSAPLVIRTTIGAGRRMGAQHSQSMYAWFAHVPGLRVALPATPADVKGLLKQAVRDKGPVVFFEHKMLYRDSGPVPDGEHLVPFGQALARRTGDDITIVASSRMVSFALTAAAELSGEGIEAEVIDLRTVVPLDQPTILESVRKSRRCLVVDEGHASFGIGSEIAALVSEKLFGWLLCPVGRVSTWDVPVPFSPALEDAILPSPAKIADAARAMCALRHGGR
jgi:acetoin:2,6-dichlorophenolindophenol oxidoreductase subunit beta